MSTAFDQIMKSGKTGRPVVKRTMWFDPDLSHLNQQIAALDKEIEDLVAAEADPTPQVEGAPKKRMNAKKRTAKDAAEERQALIDAHPESRYEVVIQAAKRDDWERLKSAHPAVDGNPVDDEYGIHWETFVLPAVRLSMFDPEPTDERWAFLEDTFSTGEWNSLCFAAMEANEGRRETPFSARAASLLGSSAD